ncbi:ImmA/IrrE family metallo-endopeptidase [Candidatus Poriferisocius sp.]|uniref:ImmA/IrrE family metallo-endopeptidase n=1 Tax=Candidatus Poriferisocius sp. TaxID=3101276 RepID=UPI003B022472
MQLRRGFKAEAADLASEIRGELELGPFDRLDPHALAQHLAIPTLRLSTLEDQCNGAYYLLFKEPRAFSACTVFDGRRRIIVYNDSHSKARQNSSLAHELSHGLLLHEPTPALDGMTGCRIWDPTKEDEAGWLAGVMLVTEDMALAVARGRFTKQDAQERWGVSKQMLTWRLNMTGAYKRVQRARAG